MKKPRLSHIPSVPGVYQIFDDTNTILYIGKSGSLKQRVQSYFVPGVDLSPGKKKMIEKASRIEFIETHSEMEALILETNLIKRYRPRYNILMKDDKNLSYISISDDPIPSISKTRKKPTSGMYFGPYSPYLNVGETLHELRKIFCLGNHTRFSSKPSPPCMDYYIGNCPGHCSGDPVKIETYRNNVTRFISFLRGDPSDIYFQLREKMNAYASRLEFEQAGRIKEQTDRLQQIHHRQIVRDALEGEYDVIAMIEKYEIHYLSCLEVRNGQIVAVQNYTLKNPTGEREDILLQTFLMHRYSENPFHGTLLLDKNYTLDDVQKYIESRGIRIHIPKRGDKLETINFARNCLLNFAMKDRLTDLASKPMKKSDMRVLLETLFPNSPDSQNRVSTENEEKNQKSFSQGTQNKRGRQHLVFECFDVSHHQGEHTVASKSVIIDGKPDSSKYKKYMIQTLDSGKIDDFASMYEILARRTRAHVQGRQVFPDLIIIDGGKGQLSHAVNAIESTYTELSHVDTEEALKRTQIYEIVRICALAKREEEVFIPGKRDPIILPRGSTSLILLQRARDEAHRFAINFQRRKREKSYTRTILEEIPGIGPKTRKALLQAFGSVDGIMHTSEEEARKYLNEKQFQSLRSYGILLSRTPEK